MGIIWPWHSGPPDADVVGFDAELVVGLHLDLLGAAEVVEIVDVGRAEVGLQRAEDARSAVRRGVLALVRSTSAKSWGTSGAERGV